MSEIIKLGPDATWGNHGKDLLTNLEHRICISIEGPYCNDDEGMNYSFSYKVPTGQTQTIDGVEVPVYEELKSSAELVSVNFKEDGEEEQVEYNGELDRTVYISVTPNSKLASLFPYAHVFIDGKEYDLGILDNPIKLITDRTHRICIHWLPGTVELFRVKPQVLK